ncbi:chalcone isomerase family protein [Tropicibacter sp. R16_0]|uniref:chalcone isomerase family protein n=1 Tax=Tropicibacter sp. R16_0 TaxID=2821102 RepID=UPI001ADB26DA|nr:chalcone isomerase family protein [Tropicibacter sp. R16_0]MBO9449892.1 chalcone isomerase family protein [Tropicibacter sp. R16_0]
MRKLLPLILITMTALPAWAEKGMSVITSAVPQAAARGEVTMRWYGFPLYDATLFTPSGAQFDWRNPVALRLVYARTIKQNAFQTATMAELERIEGKRADHAQIARKLAPCYRDASAGDHFIAQSETADQVTLWFNGTRTCTLRHPQIRERFLGIWLSDQSRSVRLSKRLRGE